MASNQFGQAQGAGAGAVCSINPQAGEGCCFFVFVVFGECGKFGAVATSQGGQHMFLRPKNLSQAMR